MRRIYIEIEYDGSNYFGWQKQPDKPTIQGEIEWALKRITGEPCEVYGSGRTDAGVHALGQVAHFDLGIAIPISKIPSVLNNILPDDINVIDAKEVDGNFHARFSTHKKCYEYNVYIGKKDNAFLSKFAARIKDELDMEDMKECAEILQGEHDFEAFCSTQTATSDFIRKIYSISIKKEKDFLKFEVIGNGFLYNMVRILVGTIIDVGCGRIDIATVQRALNCGDRTITGVTMPACGLYLKWVKY